MNKVLVKGDTRRFLVINASEYNGVGEYKVQEADFAGTKELGFVSSAEQDKINELRVGGILGQNNEFAPFEGVYVMRIA